MKADGITDEFSFKAGVNDLTRKRQQMEWKPKWETISSTDMSELWNAAQ